MSHEGLLSVLSEDRELFVFKVLNEMYVDARANARGRENQKAYFLQLVEGSEELSGVEKRWCREQYIYCFELNNAVHKWGEPRECDKCQTTRYSDKYCERCIVYTYRTFSILGHLEMK